MLEIPKIDPKRVNKNWCCHSNGVEYYLYRDDKHGPEYIPEDAVKEFQAEKKTGACFSQVGSSMQYYKELHRKWPNRLYYRMVQDREDPELTIEEKERWIVLSRENGFLPSYALSYGMLEEKATVMVVDLDDGTINPPLLYIYLSTLRHVREKPGFVKSVLYLVDELGMDYYAAAIYASKAVVTGDGHHYTNGVRPYGAKDACTDSLEINASDVAGLFRMINNPKMYDKRKIKDLVKGSWQCNSQTGIYGAGKGINIMLKKEHLFDKRIVGTMKTISLPSEDLRIKLVALKKDK